MDAKTYFHVYSMTRKAKKKTRQLQRVSANLHFRLYRFYEFNKP